MRVTSVLAQVAREAVEPLSLEPPRSHLDMVLSDWLSWEQGVGQLTVCQPGCPSVK